jgi:hypothetical protein
VGGGSGAKKKVVACMSKASSVKTVWKKSVVWTETQRHTNKGEEEEEEEEEQPSCETLSLKKREVWKSAEFFVCFF